MEPHPVLPGQDGALAQQLAADGEGGAGGQDDLAHGAGPGIVIGLDDPGGVRHDFIHRLYHAVRGQSSVLPGEVHAAPGGYHPDAQLLRGGELRADEVPGPRRKDVVVVKAGGASVLQELPHAGEGAAAHHLFIQVLPDLVQGRQPVEQLQVLHLGQVPGEHLVEVVVGVDEARITPVVAAVQDGVRLTGKVRPQGRNDAVPAQKVHLLEHPVAVVAGDGGMEVANQQRRHGGSRSFVTIRPVSRR